MLIFNPQKKQKEREKIERRIKNLTESYLLAYPKRTVIAPVRIIMSLRKDEIN